MKKLSATLLIYCGIFISASAAVRANEVSREEFLALTQRVEQLEASLRIVKNTQVEEIASEAVAAMPMNQEDKNSLIESVVGTIQAREEKANFPWMDAGKWAMIKMGMEPNEVVAILDRPTLNEPSMHKRIDFVYTYEGRRVATARKVTGIIRFYKGEVVEVEAPEL